MLLSRILMICLLGFGLTISEGAIAANLAAGKSLYNNTPNKFNLPILGSCATSSCHTPNPGANVQLNGNGGNPAKIVAAINGNTGGMGFLGPVDSAGSLTSANVADIAAYIANPSAGAIMTMSTNVLSFGTVALNATVATQQITILNTGLVNLSVTTATLSGADAADFLLTNNCTAAVASNANCNINVAIVTTVAGTKTATLTIDSNVGPQAISLSGTVNSVPIVGSDAPLGGLTFPNTMVGATSAANNMPPSGIVTLTNNSAVSLNFVGFTLAGGFILDQAPATSCKFGTPVAAGQSCSLNVKFAPGSAGAKTGSLSIAHDVGGAPLIISLSGTGLAASGPVASLDNTILNFGVQIEGTASVAQQVILSSAGTSALTITNILDGSGEFLRTGTCVLGTLAMGSTCTIIVSFRPTSDGPKNATISITDNSGNVAGTIQTISLIGTGKSPTPTLSASALDFATLSVNASATQALKISNNSPTEPLVINGFALEGANPGEFFIDTGANECSTVTAVPVAESCIVYVKFKPATPGPFTATLAVTTNASGSPHSVTLLGSGTAPLGVAPAVSSNVGGGGCAMQRREQFDPVLLALLLLSLASAVARRRFTLRNSNAPRV